MSIEAPPAIQVCRHLGLANDAAARQDTPSTDHRCHLWQLQDRVDLTHQSTYCFTAAHRHCPWLSVPPAGKRAADRHLPKGKIAAGSGAMAAVLAAAMLVASGAGPGGLAGRLRGLSFGSGGHAGLGGVAAAVAASSPDAAGGQSVKQRAAAPGPRVLAAGTLTAAALSGTKPLDSVTTLQAATGGDIAAGNIGISFSPKSLSEAGDGVTVKIAAQPPAGLPGGPAQFSQDGSIVDIAVQNAQGKPVTTFPDPVDVLFKYNAADLAVAHGDPKVLTAAYVIDESSPELENPLHFPIGTWVFFPPSNITLDTASGTLAVHTQAIGSIFSVVSAPVSYARTLRQAQLFSSFNPRNAQLFGTKAQGTTLQVVEPQIGTRVLTRDLASDSYAYIEAKDLGPVYPAASTGT